METTGVQGKRVTNNSKLFRSAVSTLQAKSMAIVGASERAAWPSMIYNNLRDFGYPGRIELVNPRQTEVFGQRCYPSLRDLPEPVDHAMVIVPAAGVPDVLTDGEAAGVKSATVYSAMMGDGDDPESKERGAWLKDFLATQPAAGRRPELHGRLLVSRTDDWLSQHRPVLARAGLGRLPVPVRRHHQFWLRSAADRGLRFSYGITSGNEPDLDLADYLNFLVDDPHTKMIVLFIEGIRRPEAFMRRPAARSTPASRSSPSRPASRRSRRPPRSRIPARSPATMRPISRCASATASSIAARSTT